MDRLNLQVGDRSPRVAEVRESLARLGLLDGFHKDVAHTNKQTFTSEDEYFDETLVEAIKAFQQGRGINADGHITDGTLRALREASYTLGARVLSLQTNELVGDDIAQLQTQLHNLGFYSERVDGHFGPETHQAVVSYQLNSGLKADGTVGPDTLRALSYLGRRFNGGSPNSIREAEQIRSSGPNLSGKRVVIDPSLGGAERGVVVDGPFGQVTEEEILWDLAGRIEGRMIAAGMETILSRPRSANPTAQERANIANAFGADLLISLKADVYRNNLANGCSTFYFGSQDGYSSMVGEKLSGFIQREITARTPLLDCRNHGRTWDLLRKTSMPAVQVIPGYLSNPQDVAVLTDPAMRDRIAEAIVVSVKRLYLMDKDVHATGTFTFHELLEAENR